MIPSATSKAYARFQLNRTWLDKDEAASAALRRMKDILDAPAPYGMVKDAESLIRTAEGLNTALIQERRSQALQSVELQVGKVQVEFDDAKASADLRNQCLYPLQTLKRQIESQSSVAHIERAGQDAIEAADEAFRKIEVTTKAIEPSAADGDPKVYVKPRRIVKASAIAPKGFLETQADVDGYLDRLRQELEAAISAGARVEIR